MGGGLGQYAVPAFQVGENAAVKGVSPRMALQTPCPLTSSRAGPWRGMIHQDHAAKREMSGAAWCMKGRIVVLVICGGAVLLMAVLVTISWVWGIWGK